MKKILDLRSDTVTIPCEEMRQAMRDALVGDDIMREDPTVHELESLAAQILGYESAMLVVSGTMANQVAVMTFAQRGEEVIVGDKSHIYNLEVAALAALSQVQARPISVVDGEYCLEEMESAIRQPGVQSAATGLICLENTYDLNSGFPVPLDNLVKIRQLSEKHGIPVYLDGARLFNASAYHGVAPSEICKYADAAQICLTKGLGAPIGSILAGSKSFIDEARRFKQRIGGGMRQAGIIAAPAIYALNNNIARMGEDHENAYRLAEGFAKIDGLSVEPGKVKTNIVSPVITKEGWNADMFINRLGEFGIKSKKIAENRCRFITHLQVTAEDVEFIIAQVQTILGTGIH